MRTWWRSIMVRTEAIVTHQQTCIITSSDRGLLCIILNANKVRTPYICVCIFVIAHASLFGIVMFFHMCCDTSWKFAGKGALNLSLCKKKSGPGYYIWWMFSYCLTDMEQSSVKMNKRRMPSYSSGIMLRISFVLCFFFNFVAMIDTDVFEAAFQGKQRTVNLRTMIRIWLEKLKELLGSRWHAVYVASAICG